MHNKKFYYCYCKEKLQRPLVFAALVMSGSVNSKAKPVFKLFRFVLSNQGRVRRLCRLRACLRIPIPTKPLQPIRNVHLWCSRFVFYTQGVHHCLPGRCLLRHRSIFRLHKFQSASSKTSTIAGNHKLASDTFCHQACGFPCASSSQQTVLQSQIAN